MVLLFQLSSKAGILCGTITDETTQLPIPGVVVWLENTNYIDTTDVNGEFLIENIPGGTYTIILEHVSFVQKVFSNFEITETPSAQCVFDCNGVLGGTAYLDSCQTCVGGTTGLEPCTQDCNGTWGGTAYVDSCQTCVGGTTGLEPCTQDCNGVWGGTAYLDSCQTCVGGTTGLEPCSQDCNGVWGGTAYLDSCQTCVGGTTGFEPCTQDCNGTWGGTAYLDSCQTCVGGTTGLEPCVVSGSVLVESKIKPVVYYHQYEQKLIVQNAPSGVLVIYDLLGRTLFSKKIVQGESRLQLQLKNQGIYVAVIRGDSQQIYTTKFRF